MVSQHVDVRGGFESGFGKMGGIAFRKRPHETTVCVKVVVERGKVMTQSGVVTNKKKFECHEKDNRWCQMSGGPVACKGAKEPKIKRLWKSNGCRGIMVSKSKIF